MTHRAHAKSTVRTRIQKVDQSPLYLNQSEQPKPTTSTHPIKHPTQALTERNLNPIVSETTSEDYSIYINEFGSEEIEKESKSEYQPIDIDVYKKFMARGGVVDESNEELSKVSGRNGRERERKKADETWSLGLGVDEFSLNIYRDTINTSSPGQFVAVKGE